MTILRRTSIKLLLSFQIFILWAIKVYLAGSRFTRIVLPFLFTPLHIFRGNQHASKTLLCKMEFVNPDKFYSTQFSPLINTFLLNLNCMNSTFLFLLHELINGTVVSLQHVLTSFRKDHFHISLVLYVSAESYLFVPPARVWKLKSTEMQFLQW